MVDKKVIAEGLRQFTADANYFDSNYERLREQYPDEWLAIIGGEVIAHDRDYVRMAEQVGRDRLFDVYVGRTYSSEEPPHLRLHWALH